MFFLPNAIGSQRQAHRLAIKLLFAIVLGSIMLTALGSAIFGEFRRDFFVYATVIPIVIGLPSITWATNTIYEMTRLKDEIERIAHTDELTGIANRRAFFNDAACLAEDIISNHTCHAMIIIDVDNFKIINDAYGHQAGDRALIVVASLLATAAQTCDVVGRIGGEEFAMFVASRFIHDSVNLAEKIRERVANTPIVVDNVSFSITVSIGHTVFEPSDTLISAMRRADKALYIAKSTGRNRLITLNDACHA